MRAAHAAWCVELAERFWRSGAPAPLRPEWLDRLEAEHDNLHAALGWLERAGDAAAVLRLAGATWPFWLQRSHRVEGRAWLERALASAGDSRLDGALRIRALMGIATLEFTLGDYARAVELAEEGQRLCRELDDAATAALLTNLLGAIARARGEFDLATERFQETLTIYRQQAGHPRLAIALCNLGVLAY